jgi:uncharacterized delta-60 repeat protein
MKFNYLLLSILFYGSSLAQSPGDVDPAFLMGTGFNGTVQTMGRLSNGKIFAGGDFTQYQGTPAPRVILLNNDGTRDVAFQSNTTTGANLAVRSSFVLPNDKLLLGGIFQTYNGAARPNFIQLLPDGRIDSTFNPGGTGPNNEVTHITSDGNSIIISGFFSQYNGLPAPGTVVLTMNGVPDPTFTTAMIPQIQTSTIAPNGDIYIGGNFSTAVGAPQNRIARLLPSGALDPSFQVGTGFTGVVRTITIQPDGRILVGGAMSNYNGTPVGRIARLFPNGTLDPSFQTTTGFNTTVTKLTLQPNGKIIVTGLFTQFNGQPAPFIERLESDGRKDACINFGTGFQGNTTGLELEPTGSFTVSGGFTFYKGQQRNRIIRIFDTLVTGATLPLLSTNTYTLPCAIASLPMQILGGVLNDAPYWEWYKDSCSGTPIDTGWSPVLQNISGGNYFVKGKGASACNCTGFTVVGGGIDTIAPIPDSLQLPAIQSYCAATITQIPTATDSCAGAVAGTTQDPLVYNQPGVYTLTWRYTDPSGNTSTQMQQVEILSINKTLQFSFNSGTNLYEITAGHQTATAQYFWMDCQTGIIDSSQQGPVYTTGIQGTYAAIIVEGTCTDTTDCLPVNITSVDGSFVTPIKLYPNPTSGAVLLEMPKSVFGTVRICNAQGQVIWQQEVQSAQTWIETTPWAAGVYWLLLPEMGAQPLKLVKF